MPQSQQSWAFRIGDGGQPEAFTQLGGMHECPDFRPFNRTLRKSTTIADVQNEPVVKKSFNKMMEGPELSITLDYLPGDVGQAALTAAEGSNTGVNCQFEIIGATDTGTITDTYEFNVLVVPRSYSLSSADDENAVDRVQYTLVVNSLPVLTTVEV